MNRLIVPAVFAVFALALVCIVSGWIMNVITVIHWVGTVTPEFIIRCIGIVVPIIGAIMGWL